MAIENLTRGAFTLKWGDNVIDDIETIKINYKVDTVEKTVVQGKKYTIDGAHSVIATITLLASDIAALAALLPQYYVPDGGKLSTGETVNDAQGAIDVVPQQPDQAIIYNHFDIISKGNPGQTMRIVNARTQINGADNDDKLRVVMVDVIGESNADEATVQFFNNGNIATVS